PAISLKVRLWSVGVRTTAPPIRSAAARTSAAVSSEASLEAGWRAAVDMAEPPKAKRPYWKPLSAGPHPPDQREQGDDNHHRQGIGDPVEDVAVAPQRGNRLRHLDEGAEERQPLYH